MTDEQPKPWSYYPEGTVRSWVSWSDLPSAIDRLRWVEHRLADDGGKPMSRNVLLDHVRFVIRQLEEEGDALGRLRKQLLAPEVAMPWQPPEKE